MEHGYIFIGVAKPGPLEIVSKKEAVLKCDIRIRKYCVIGRDARHFYIDDDHGATIPFQIEDSGKDLQPRDLKTVTWIHEKDNSTGEDALRKQLTQLHNEKMSRMTLTVKPEAKALSAI